MKIIQRILVIFYLLLLAGIPGLRAQNLKLEHFDIQNGLPATEVYNLYQDKKGYLWAFTEYGIVKHNGNKFIPVCTNIPLIESAVYAVCESSAGNIYIANSKAAIYRIANDSAFLIKGMEKISREILARSEVIFDIWVDESSSVYFSTLRHSYYFDSQKQSVRDLSLVYTNDSTGIYFKLFNKHSFPIKLKDQHKPGSVIRTFDKEDHLKETVPYEQFPGERVILLRRKDTSYFISRNRVTKCTSGKVALSKKYNANILTAEVSANGHLWIGTANEGVWELDSSLRTINCNLAKLTVSDILFDNQSGAWISTIGNGIYYCRNIYDKYYGSSTKLGGTISMLKMLNEKLFIGTAAGDLFIQDENGLHELPNDGKESYITDITYLSSHYVAGTKNGIFGLDEHLKLVPGLSALSSGFLGCNGISNWDKDSVIFISASSIFKKSLSSPFIESLGMFPGARNIILRKDHEFLIGTRTGLYQLKGNNINFHFLTALEGRSISRLKAGPGKTIWICTKGDGLYVLSESGQLTKPNHVPSDVVNDISFINDSLLLLSTNRGLYLTMLNGLKNKESWTRLMDDEILRAESYNGKIYVATKLGLVVLNSWLSFSGSVPFYLESCTVNDVKYKKPVSKLHYYENDLRFNFDLLDYSKPETDIAYQLKGPVSVEDTIRSTELHFQNLPPGVYELRVTALLNTGNRHNHFIIPFTIEAPFWQTGLFIVIVAFLVITLAIFIVVFFYRRLKKKEEKKAFITRMLIEHRLTALKAQMNPHFISNSLTAIQLLVSNNQIDKANLYIARFSLLLRYILKYSDKFVASLSSEIEIIDLNVDLEQLRFNNSFVFEKEIGPEVNPGTIYIPPLITQPFIENAIWHGLLPLKDLRPPKLTLAVSVSEDHLIIRIIDNGVGRRMKKANEPGERESKGTWLIRNKLENINRMYSTDGIVVDYNDLKDALGNPCGTEVKLVFPLNVLNKLYDEKDQMYPY